MQSLRSRLRLLAEWVTAILFVAMFAAFLLQVFTRYVLNSPVAWTQEFVLIVYIWIVFWCGAFLLREREHITFDMVFVSLPPGPRRVLAVILTLITLAAFVAALPGTVDYISFMKIEKSPVMGIRFDLLYSIFAVFAIAVAVGALMRLRRLLGRSWRDELKTEGEIEP
ncbi:TRAP transporter small permease [Microvirga subterranea]|uniref:TRAP transporter small permease protein n=1 Tax=Microvirga subterranea TaxID=186651 RepID=A0A370HKU3_9HYPH|nr:TRAP transporter small permease [Microvirga subterranea]RDI59129.1 TRAP-type C4-dicarboxylate transport system permease small subunit [Microvirga subterranea]